MSDSQNPADPDQPQDQPYGEPPSQPDRRRPALRRAAQPAAGRAAVRRPRRGLSLRVRPAVRPAAAGSGSSTASSSTASSRYDAAVRPAAVRPAAGPAVRPGPQQVTGRSCWPTSARSTAPTASSSCARWRSPASSRVTPPCATQTQGGWFPAKQLPGLFSHREWLTTVLLSALPRRASAWTGSTSATPASASEAAHPRRLRDLAPGRPDPRADAQGARRRGSSARLASAAQAQSCGMTSAATSSRWSRSSRSSVCR